MARVLVACLAVVAFTLVGRPAFAKVVPPPLDHGHVVDTAGVLSAQDIDDLNRRMEGLRLRSGYVVDAFVVKSLDGETIADVAADTFQLWKPGDKEKDNGVLIVIAPNDRRDRIEVGKGVEGALTDLQTDDIRRQKIEPRLAEGDIAGAIAAGTIAIGHTLTADNPGTPQNPVGDRQVHGDGGGHVIVWFVILVFVILAISRGGRGGGGGPGFFWFGGGGGFGGGGDGGGFGGGDGGGFGGGGGSSGGGGSDGSY